MRTRAETIWIVIGAVLGGMIVGPFRLHPTWLWGMLGGVLGALVGAAAAFAAARSWRWPLPFLAASLIMALGFFALWYVAGRQYVLDPSNWEIRNP